MATTRIKFRNLDASGEYELTVNPVNLDLVTAEDYQLHDSLDGAPVKQKPSFDSRQRKITWKHHKTSGSSHATTFNTMMSTLRGYVGKRKEIKLEDADYLALYAAHGWMEIEIDDVIVNRREGGVDWLDIEIVYHYTQSY